MTIKQDRANQIAIIVEGGGFKSAFTAGILDSFIMNGYDPFQLYLGISSGAMNMTSYVSQQYKRNINIISSSVKGLLSSFLCFISCYRLLPFTYSNDKIIKFFVSAI